MEPDLPRPDENAPLPEYPFGWESEARFQAVKAAQDVLSRCCVVPPSVTDIDDAIEAAVKAYNAYLGGGS